MNSKKFLALVSVAVGLSFSFNAYAAKEIKISSNNTAYSDAKTGSHCRRHGRKRTCQPQQRKRCCYRIRQQRNQMRI